MNAFVARSGGDTEVGCISWSAVIAGVVAALGVASLLNLLGMGLGLASFSFDLESVKTLGFAAILWLVFNSIVSMFFGGWVAGLLAGKLENRVEYLLHGFLMWSISLMLTFFIATTSVGFAVSGVLGVTQKALTAAGKGVAELGMAVAPQVKNVVSAAIPQDSALLKNINQQSHDIFKKAQEAMQKNLPASEVESAGAKSLAQESLTSTYEEFSQSLEKLFKANGDANIQEAKEAVIQLLVEKGDMNQDRATEVVSKWYDRYQKFKEKAQDKAKQAKQYAANVTEKASSILSKLALISLVTLLFGVAAACTGAYLASTKEEKLL